MKLSAFFPIIFLFSTLFADVDHSASSTFKITQCEFDQTTYYPFFTIDIVLKNGSHWITDAHINYKENLEKWVIGDLVEIHKLDCLHYSLNNLSQPMANPYHFRLDKSTQNAFPKVESIEENGYQLILNDGSQWSIGYWSARHLEVWNIGDGVLIAPSKARFGNATHVLYNTNLENYYYINATWMNPID